jgi:hypothetical protein
MPATNKFYIIFSYEKRGLTGVKTVRRCEVVEVQYNLDTAVGLTSFIAEREQTYTNFIIESWKKLS